MIDFRSALAAGLSAAKAVDLNKREIEDKLKSISEMLYDGTFGKVALVFSENSSHREAMMGNPVDNIYVVSQTDTSKGVRIGTIIHNSESGYPLLIEADASKFVCNSPSEIEVAFSEIVQINSVANAIFSLAENKV